MHIKAEQVFKNKKMYKCPGGGGGGGGGGTHYILGNG